jgi:hypothetical protein
VVPDTGWFTPKKKKCLLCFCFLFFIFIFFMSMPFMLCHDVAICPINPKQIKRRDKPRVFRIIAVIRLLVPVGTSL